MAINDPLGDMLTRIRNAQMRGKARVTTPASSLRARVLDVLETEGFIRGYDSYSFGAAECDVNGTNCFDFNRLLGSKMLVMNLELRFPLFGALGLGRLRDPRGDAQACRSAGA